MDTKGCVCGRNMILVGRGGELLSQPPVQNRVWICYGCGNEEEGPPYRSKTKEAIERKMWEEAQSRTVWVGEHRLFGKPYYWTGEVAFSPNTNHTFVFTDDIHKARQFPSEKVAFEVLSANHFWPTYQIAEHMIG